MAARLGSAVIQAQGLAPWRLSLLAPSAQQPPSPAARECPSPPRAAAPAADRRRIATVPRSAPRWPPAQVAGFLSMPRFAWAANSTFPFHRYTYQSRQSRVQQETPRRSWGYCLFPLQNRENHAVRSSSSMSLQDVFSFLEYARNAYWVPFEQSKAELRLL